MSKPKNRLVGSRIPSRTAEQGSTRMAVLGLVCLAAGFAGGAFWYPRSTQKAPKAEAGAGAAIQLAAGAKSILKRMEAPVEIRFYSLFTEEPAAESGRLFAGRVGQLLAAIESASGGKVRLVRHTAPDEAERRAAVAEGLTPLDIETGDACYLGMVVAQGNHREAFPQLAPEWELAVEADVMRAVLRVAAAAHRAARPAQTSEAELAAAREVQNSLPNLATLSAEEAERMLRETAMQELKTVAAEMEAQAQAARQQLDRAQQTGTEAERQAAARQLQQIRAEQTAKLKTAAARLRDQIAAMERLKAASPAAAPSQSQPASAPQR